MRLIQTLLGLCIGLAAGLAQAEQAAPSAPQFPTLVDVVDVAADDVLNIRAEPDASSEIIGAFAHDAQGVEVLGHSEDGRWAKVGAFESMGWISRRFVTASTAAPLVTCHGNEPFWTVQTDPPAMVTPDSRVPMQPAYAVQSDADDGLIGGAVYSADEFWLYLRYWPEQCYDDMADREYGVVADVDLLLPGRGVAMLRGCCSIGHARPLAEH